MTTNTKKEKRERWTPGPWNCFKTGESIVGYERYGINGKGGLGVCFTGGRYGKANARLIAAAPELLECAELLTEAFPNCECEEVKNEKSKEKANGCIHCFAEAALLKARGQQ